MIINMGFQEEKMSFEKKLKEKGYSRLEAGKNRHLYGQMFGNYYITFETANLTAKPGPLVAAYAWYMGPAEGRELVRSQAFGTYDGKNIENAQREFAAVIKTFSVARARHLEMPKELEAILKK
jgi:hypothetical protein